METGPSQRVSRSPKCARCRNHGFVVALKGHAGRCRFTQCHCWKCALITERTRIMANHRRVKKSQRAEEHETGNAVNSDTVIKRPDTRDKPDIELKTPSRRCASAPHTRAEESAVYSGDLGVAMAPHVLAHYTANYTRPAFMFSFGVPPLGTVGFPHVPQAALIDSRQNDLGFFYAPYLFHPNPEHYPQYITESADKFCGYERNRMEPARSIL